MAQYISKSALVAEIEKRIKEEIASTTTDFSYYSQGCVDSMRKVLSLLDTLEVKEMDLEKEIRETCRGYRATDSYDATISKKGIENIARYFFNLGLKVQKGE